jgi:3-isopropylmalate/(R)-2-methylmalate dehydratase small subunit
VRAFSTHTGLVAPLDRANVDTDAILPKQFMKSIHKSGFGPHLFDEWRFLDRGVIGMNPDTRTRNPRFVLNQPRYAGASILLSRRNFGAGSSREHAQWALDEYGFRALVAPSYADIFLDNCMRNGLCAVALPEAVIDSLFALVEATPGFQMTVDLPAQCVMLPNDMRHAFEFDAFHKARLLAGLDDIGATLEHTTRIQAFETQHFARFPWLARRC